MIDLSNEDTVIMLKNKVEYEEKIFNIISEEQKIRLDRINLLKATIKSFSAEQQQSERQVEPILTRALVGSNDEYTYPQKASWKDKIVGYIKHKNKAILTTQMVKYFAKFEEKMDEKQILNIVSNNLSTLVSNGIVKTYKPKKMKGYYYVNPAWFDTDGNILEQHKPEMKEVTVW